MKFLIVKKESNKKIDKDLNKLLKILDRKKCVYDIIDYVNIESFIDNIDNKKVKKYDILISFGGDGTILKSARIARKLDLPILGINEGTLGFLTTIGLLNINFYIDKLLKKDYIYEKRSMLGIFVYRKGKQILSTYAVNEATFMTSNLGKIGKYEVYIENLNSKFNEYRADGLIISNPTGSTGHSFSAGGPIVAPNVNCYVITAICPHAFNQRSIIISGESDIFVKIVNDGQVVDIDGRISETLLKGDVVKINTLKKKLNFITFNNNLFINNISKKIKNL